MAIATPMREGAEVVGEHGYRYLLVKALGQPNVWIAVDAASQEKIFIVKQPGTDDVGLGWPRFQHEMIMHELLKDIPTIRQQVDRIPPRSGEPPRIVLEILESTLWDARRRREFSNVEIKGIMRSALEGLRDVHQRGLVYADLKMQNILVSGFEREPNTTSTVEHNNITAKLGDLGIVMEPAKGLVQPIVYRAPEVYFRNEISPAADIWSWGLIYCQLLEAQAAFHKYGIYDELLLQTSQVQKERSVERAIAHDFGLGGLNYYRDAPLPYHDRSHPEGKQWDYLRNKGISEKEIEFLQWVLDPVPTDRPTAQDILDAGWLTSASSESTGVEDKLSADLKARNKNLRRKRSDPGLSKTLGEQPPAPQGLSASSMFAVQQQQQQPVQIQQQFLPPQQHQPVQPVQFQQQQQAQQSHMPVNESMFPSRPPRAKDNQSAPVLQRGDVPAGDGARPATPRSSTERPTGSTFINYGALMR